MQNKRQKYMKRLTFAISLLMAAMMVSAQEAPEKLPMDPEVRYGKLDNGLTYYIRHNEQPKECYYQESYLLSCRIHLY